MNEQTDTQGTSKIRHAEANFDRDGGATTPASASSVAPIELDEELSELQMVDDAGGKKKEIRAFGQKKRHEDQWDRTPNTNGTGAIHVKTFHSKITEDALRYMDQQINEWLDAHPQYEVKFVNSNIGEFTGKIKEPHVICQVWV